MANSQPSVVLFFKWLYLIRTVGCLLNGKNATIDEFPYVVVFVDGLDNREPYCQGALIQPDDDDSPFASSVITTANCICRKNGKEYALENLVAILGGINEPNRVTRRIKAAKYMEFDLRDPSSHDMAYVRLDAPVEFDEHIHALPLRMGMEVAAGSQFFAASYGPIGIDDVTGDNIYPERLQKMKIRMGSCAPRAAVDSEQRATCIEGLPWTENDERSVLVPTSKKPEDFALQSPSLVCLMDGRLSYVGLQNSAVMGPEGREEL